MTGAGWALRCRHGERRAEEGDDRPAAEAVARADQDPGRPPEHRRAIETNFPDVHRVPAVFISAGTDEDFELVHSKMWKQIALALTGLPSSKLREMGVVLYDPFTKRDLERVF